MKVEIDLDELNDLKEQLEYQKRQCAEKVYRGNSIGYIYDKMVCYRNQIDGLVKERDELRAMLAIYGDGRPSKESIEYSSRGLMWQSETLLRAGSVDAKNHPLVVSEWLKRIASLSTSPIKDSRLIASANEVQK